MLGATRAEHGELVRTEDALGERIAAPREDAADAAHVANVGADAEDHRRSRGRPQGAGRPLGKRRTQRAREHLIGPGRSR